MVCQFELEVRVVQEQDLEKEAMLQAGMTEAEAVAWSSVGNSAKLLLELPGLSMMDKYEITSAIHVIQNKLAAMPVHRKYLSFFKK